MMYKQNFVAVIKCRGQILRERSGGTVYLPFGSKYSILLKNKDARRALVRIEVDGKNVLKDHSLIMSGNETQEIKGFMQDLKKTNRFKFISKTKEIQKHRGDRIDDGLVRVTYQFEKHFTYEDSSPINITYKTHKRPDYDLGSGLNFGCANWTWSDNSSSVIGTRNAFCNLVSYSTSNSFAPTPDEGITVRGEKINQAFCYGDVGELETSIHTIVLYLKGQTKRKKALKRPLTVKSKLKCTTCGRKNRSTNKFCYNCGTYLD